MPLTVLLIILTAVLSFLFGTLASRPSEKGGEGGGGLVLEVSQNATEESPTKEAGRAEGVMAKTGAEDLAKEGAAAPAGIRAEEVIAESSGEGAEDVIAQSAEEPTMEPTPEPTPEPTAEPTAEPTPEPTAEPTPKPTAEPTPKPTAEPTPEPTAASTQQPSVTQADPGDVNEQRFAAPLTGRSMTITVTLGNAECSTVTVTCPDGSVLSGTQNGNQFTFYAISQPGTYVVRTTGYSDAGSVSVSVHCE